MRGNGVAAGFVLNFGGLCDRGLVLGNGDVHGMAERVGIGAGQRAAVVRIVDEGHLSPHRHAKVGKEALALFVGEGADFAKAKYIVESYTTSDRVDRIMPIKLEANTFVVVYIHQPPNVYDKVETTLADTAFRPGKYLTRAVIHTQRQIAYSPIVHYRLQIQIVHIRKNTIAVAPNAIHSMNATSCRVITAP